MEDLAWPITRWINTGKLAPERPHDEHSTMATIQVAAGVRTFPKVARQRAGAAVRGPAGRNGDAAPRFASVANAVDDGPTLDQRVGDERPPGAVPPQSSRRGRTAGPTMRPKLKIVRVDPDRISWADPPDRPFSTTNDWRFGVSIQGRDHCRPTPAAEDRNTCHSFHHASGCPADRRQSACQRQPGLGLWVYGRSNRRLSPAIGEACRPTCPEQHRRQELDRW
jgi:hypothetical protein